MGRDNLKREMTYEELPLVPIKIKRGNTKKVSFQGFAVDGVPIDLTTACLKVQFKPSVDACRYIEYELTEDNGGLVITPNRVDMNFGRETSKIQYNVLYGDLLMRVNDGDHTIIRLELKFSGVVTTKNSDEC